MQRVIVTRAQREAQVWVRDLAAAGFDAQALPLIEIRAATDAMALREAWQHLADYAAVMFVSANAVDGFFSAVSKNTTGDFKLRDASHFSPRAWATGPGTVAALERAGVAAALIDAPSPSASQFDSEALWQIVGNTVRSGERVLIVRGTSGDRVTLAAGQALGKEIEQGAAQGVGRDWLARQLIERGVRAEFVVAYQRGCPILGSSQVDMARAAAHDASVWLFSSSQAVANLCACLPEQNWAKARAVATHARIAAACQQAGFGQVVPTRPVLGDIVASIESLS